MQKLSVSMFVVSALVLSACVSESTYVGSERPVQQRQVDNTEAARTRMSLGLNYLQRGENAQAIFNLERARILAPNLPEVYNALAYYYQSVNEAEQAEAAYKQALARDADNPDTYNNYGAFLCQQEKYDEAEVLLLTAIRRPGYIRVSESYENLALCQLQQNNFSRAQHYLESAVLHSSNRISSLLNLAALDYAMGRHQRARQHLTRIQRLGHVSADTALLSFLLADKELDSETQKNARELLLQVYPDSRAARLLREGRVQDTEFEQLRERYKTYLLSSVEIPAAVVAEAPVSQPQIRIVRREQTATQATEGASSVSLSPQAAASSVAVTSNETSLIADSLSSFSGTQPRVTEPSVTRLQPEPQPDVLSEMSSMQHSIAETAAFELTSLTRSLQLFEPSEALSDATIPAKENESAPAINGHDPVNELLARSAVHDSEPKDLHSLPTAQRDDDQAMQEYSSDGVAYHLVQQGESLFAISMQYNIRLEKLQLWNQLSPAATIRTGQKIWLAEPAPAPVTEVVAVERPDFHVVERGDTLFSISMHYNVRLAQLLHWNNLTKESRVYVGQHIYLINPADLNHDN
ncbi:type IV pilus biogenesis/stability protein PilW [Alkalimonas mucilaginosa]|uniref:Type IV pilus biogenesis/stability protein PilW n=1 Tax=Alkalimonas mucilaginosa TaxID=3057676 RepID=A0ABU7JCN4_9GAMM|nr:type IV pilus biogenesis/stability protein PilW [Alkalimonas sp. MEB004]MEE2023446.1 type IV pilus biogenesis/stability protein PilW [Alkalimonas sp. MEB004]